MAHVVVEPNRAFSHRLKPLARARNVYGGTIGVYWPQSEARRAYFLNEDRPVPRALEVEISKDIRVALSNRRPRTNCTWAHLKESLARARLDQLKARGATDVQEYVDAFDVELAAKQALLAAAEQEVARLTAEVRRLSASEQRATGGLLQRGEEHDLYSGEIPEMVREALDAFLRNSPEDSRTHHVLSDLLKANPQNQNREQMEEELKNLLRGYRDMDNKTRSALTRLGFDLSEDGKHYKVKRPGIRGGCLV